MAPPLKPIARARSQFFGEPEPSQFFPPSPALKTMSPFGQYDSPALLGEQMMEREDILARRNKLATDLAGGAYQRQQYASQGRILPYSEQVAIASAQLAEKQALGNLEDFPQTQEADRVTRDYRMAQAKQGMQDIPAQAQYEQEQRGYNLERMAADDVNVRRLQSFAKNPGTLLAYERFQEDPALSILPTAQRKKAAYTRALQLEQDSEAIDAIDTILQTDPAANPAKRGMLVEPVFDPVTKSFIGERIKDSADRGMVSQYIAKAKNQRRQMDIEREKRQSESAAQRIQASGTSFAARMAEIAIKNPEIFDTLTPEEQEEAKQTILRGAGVGKEPEQKKAGALDRL
jgi:hypothetical protein